MSLVDIAPRIGRAHAAEQAHRMRHISRCWQGGWHANGAGPCLDTPEAAMRHRDFEDRQQRSCSRGGTHVRRHGADVGDCLKCGRWSVA